MVSNINFAFLYFCVRKIKEPPVNTHLPGKVSVLFASFTFICRCYIMQCGSFFWYSHLITIEQLVVFFPSIF